MDSTSAKPMAGNQGLNQGKQETNIFVCLFILLGLAANNTSQTLVWKQSVDVLVWLWTVAPFSRFLRYANVALALSQVRQAG